MFKRRTPSRKQIELTNAYVAMSAEPYDPGVHSLSCDDGLTLSKSDGLDTRQDHPNKEMK